MRKHLTIVVQVFLWSIALVMTNAAQQPTFKPLDPKIYEPYLGTYQLSSGELIVIGRSVRRLYYYEPHTGRARGLNPQSESSAEETTWSAGPSLLVYSPKTFQITFTKNRSGDVIGLILKEAGRSDRIAKKALFYKEEEVTFQNGDVTLGGKLLIPSTKGPHPAVILLHGSGAQDRNGERSEIRWVADHFARHGIVALIYDKRGFGASTGNWATASFNDFAKDALAGLKLLQGRPDINPKQIGMWGVSQAGWVMTTATSMSKDIAFIISISAGGSGYTPAQQNNYNIETEMRAQGFTQNEISQVITSYNLLYDVVRAGEGGDGSKLDAAIRLALQKNAKLKDWLPPLSSEINWKKRDQWFLAFDIDFNPLPLWERYDGPVLGIFGELDSSTPVQQVVPLLGKALAARRNTDYAIKVFPKANHNIMEAETGSDNELPRLNRFVPEYLDTMTDWLRSRVDLKT
ncbi:MAG TPA: alpha/beta fold hydrolase [Pyrinomonadaceae bacterium]|jgi:pimeloyl-ACP methyl ester carboxylesterase